MAATTSEKCIFVAFADHELSKEEHNFLNILLLDMRRSGYTLYHRPNYREQSAAQITLAVEYGLSRCDCLVAIINKRSDTVGRIIGLAQGKLQILFLAREGEHISRMYRGLVERGLADMQTYAREEQVFNIISTYLQQIVSSAAD